MMLNMHIIQLAPFSRTRHLNTSQTIFFMESFARGKCHCQSHIGRYGIKCRFAHNSAKNNNGKLLTLVGSSVCFSYPSHSSFQWQIAAQTDDTREWTFLFKAPLNNLYCLKLCATFLVYVHTIYYYFFPSEEQSVLSKFMLNYLNVMLYSPCSLAVLNFQNMPVLPRQGIKIWCWHHIYALQLPAWSEGML